MSTRTQSGWPQQWFRGHPVPTGAGRMLPMQSIGVGLNKLMAQHDGLVQPVARQQVLGDLPFPEALQAGRIGLWRAILGFDPSRGLGLSGERARQLHTEALVWLRHPAHCYVLRGLLDRHTLADYQAADELAQRWLRRRGGQGGH